ncbi:hypothetical protein ScPMuIL_010695 [Solemya velum]
MKTEGKTDVKLMLGEKEVIASCVIAEMKLDGILELDFLRTHKYTDEGLRPPSGDKGFTGLSETVTVPARSEIIVKGSVPSLKGQKINGELGVVEPHEKLVSSDRGLVARTLVKRGEVVPMRIMNLSSEPSVLYQGTTIGSLSPIDKVLDSEEPHQQDHDLPDHLEDLQREKAKAMLVEFADLFAKTDNDIGRTGIVKHSIDTGNARPRKEPPRQIPCHLNEDMNRQIDDMLERDVIEPRKKMAPQGFVWTIAD